MQLTHRFADSVNTSYFLGHMSKVRMINVEYQLSTFGPTDFMNCTFWELIKVWYLPQKCGNAAMPQSGKSTELNIAFPGSLRALHLISNIFIK